MKDSVASPVRCWGVRLPAEPAAAGAAREFVRAAARQWRLPARTREIALLVASELVTNVVQHTAAPSHLTVRCERGWLDIAVHDPDPTPPTRVSERTRPDQALCGLDVIAALALDWGVTRDDRPGKTVWARLPVPPER